MTVKELIAILQSKPQDLLVAYSKYSEWCMLDVADIGIRSLGAPRTDGWVPDARPDEPTQEYLTLPGN